MHARMPACMQIAVQIAVVFAKVARFDYPRAWPLLLGDLLGRLQGGSSSGPDSMGGSGGGGGGSGGPPSTLAVRRVYLVLHHILKELASKRLLSDQKNFEQVRKYVKWEMKGERGKKVACACLEQ